MSKKGLRELCSRRRTDRIRLLRDNYNNGNEEDETEVPNNPRLLSLVEM